ncbi:hypothetical protein [Paraliomyxa miuraensis]|uniref:hypothetical protein n=1 Tax=Paraliomyxa miuraensis TaxID=376150 RepID=UPI0022597248|nr:hypothetical protein [Paraliomyxa miuraensis]MCX4247499.1 hypothetical protein [Paraliomyxa miuraensis]
MPARLRAHPIAAADPTRAAQQVASAVLADAPRGRPLVLAVVRWGAHPGLHPSPWCLDGVVHAIEEAGLQAGAVQRGDRGATDPLAVQLATRRISPLDEDGPSVTVCLPGSRHGVRVPRALVGHSLCLVVPCVHHQRTSERGPSWRGPIGAGLVSLTSSWGASPTRSAVERAARCASEVFAHVSVVIDAGWWAFLSSREEASPLLLTPERMLGLRLASPITGSNAIDPRHADAWLGLQLGLPMRRRPAESPTVLGPAAHTPWPKLPRPALRGPNRAREGFAALWRPTEPSRSRRVALPPAVPGSLAHLWDEYRASQPATTEGRRGRPG